jgi:hypothetical protein
VNDAQLESLRKHLLNLLEGRGAHADFDAAIADFPTELRRAKPNQQTPHTAWQLVEHLRIAQSDILEFSRNPKHVSPSWPDGYWPQHEAPDAGAWDRSVEQFLADLKAMRDLIADPNTDLFAPFPHGEGQTLLREALLVADHNAYHIGQLVLLRKQLGNWHA